MDRFPWLICLREIPMSACNHTKNKGGGTNFKVEIQIICERNEQKKFWAAVCTTVQNFSASLLTFAPSRYFDLSWLSPILWFFPWQQNPCSNFGEINMHFKDCLANLPSVTAHFCASNILFCDLDWWPQNCNINYKTCTGYHRWGQNGTFYKRFF